MQLQLQAHGEAVFEDPFGEPGGVLLAVAGGEQEFAHLIQLAAGDEVARPFVVGAVADDELDLVGWGQRGEVFVGRFDRLVYVQSLLQFDVGLGSAGGVFAIILANIVAIFLMRMIGKNLEA